MEKENSYSSERSRQVLLIISSGIGLIIGIVVIMLCIQTLFINESASHISFSNTCSDWEPINFFKQISICKIILIASAGVSCCMLVILIGMTLYCAIKNGVWENSELRMNVAYAIVISIGLLTALVCFLKSMKVYSNSQQILSSNLDSTCFSMSSQTNMEGKKNEIFAMFILAGIMLLMYVCGIVFVPSRFIIGRNPKQNKIQKKSRIPSIEISNEHLFNKKNEQTAEIIMPVSTSRHEIGVATDNNLLIPINAPEIMKEEKGVSTNPPPLMKNFKSQVLIHTPTLPVVQETQKEKEKGLDVGIGTKNDLYKVKDAGLMAVVKTNTVGVGKLQQVSYQECGIGEGNVLEKDREREDGEQLEIESETTKYELIQSPLKSFSPKPLESSRLKLLNATEVEEKGYYFLNKAKKEEVEPQVKGIYVEPPFVENPSVNPIRPRSRLSRSKFNREIKVESDSEEIVEAGIVAFSNQNTLNIESKQSIEYELMSESPSKKDRRQRLEKLREKFTNSSKRRSRSQSPAYIHQFEMDCKQIEKDKLEIEKSTKYNKSQMEEYKLCNSLTPHKSKLKNKGIVPSDYFQKDNKDENKKKGKCDFLEPGEWCGNLRKEE